MRFPGAVAFFPVLALVVMVSGIVQPAAAQLAPPYFPDYEDELFAAVAQAHGMPDLKQTGLPPTYREIRIRDHLSSVDAPTPMLRLVSGEGRASEGELLLFRRTSLGPGNPPPRPDERCVPLLDQHVCVRTPATSIDAPRVATMLNQLGAWEIAERCDYVPGSNSVSGYTHVGDLYIQRLIGRSFSAYRCNAPQYRTAIEAGQKANAIYQYFRQLVGPLPVR